MDSPYLKRQVIIPKFLVFVAMVEKNDERRLDAKDTGQVKVILDLARNIESRFEAKKEQAFVSATIGKEFGNCLKMLYRSGRAIEEQPDYTLSKAQAAIHAAGKQLGALIQSVSLHMRQEQDFNKKTAADVFQKELKKLETLCNVFGLTSAEKRARPHG